MILFHFQVQCEADLSPSIGFQQWEYTTKHYQSIVLYTKINHNVIH